MNLLGGIFVFLMLSIILWSSVGLCIFIATEIHKTTGWKAVGHGFLLLIFLGLIATIIYVAGDQLATGYHMYG